MNLTDLEMRMEFVMLHMLAVKSIFDDEQRARYNDVIQAAIDRNMREAVQVLGKTLLPEERDRLNNLLKESLIPVK